MQGRTGWKVYAWLLAAGQAGAYALGFTSLQSTPSEVALSVADIAINVVAVIGLFGFAYHRRIANARVWRVAFPALIAWHTFCIAFPTIGPGHHALDQVLGFAAIAVLTLVLLVPEYIGLFRYGHRDPELWAAKNAG